MWHNRRVRALGRRIFYGLRNEGAGAPREAAAIGLGVFIGCLPVFGFHLLLCFVAGALLGLNRLKMYLAANISNPFFAPTLLFAELQIGSLMRRGAAHPLTLEAARQTELSVFGADIIVGSLAVGAMLGAILAGVTYASVRATGSDPAFLTLVRAASDRYVTSSITAWEFARGKLRGDPMYRAIVCGGLLPPGGTLVDIGCGSGLTLALLAEARTWSHRVEWPRSWNAPPVFDRMVGIEMRQGVVNVAREALGADAEIVQADAGEVTPEICQAVLICDVLHMMPSGTQQHVLAAAVGALTPGGTLIVREADASAGWRFTAVRIGNFLKALAFGHWRQRFHFRTTDEWLRLFSSHGLTAEALPNGEGTPFASVLFRLRVPPISSAASSRLAPTA